MRLPGAYNFAIKQGAPWTDTIIWKIDDVPVDLTGYTATLRVRFASGPVTFTPSVNSSGEVSWTIPQATVDAWPAGFTSYDIKVTSGGGTSYWLLAGTLEVVA